MDESVPSSDPPKIKTGQIGLKNKIALTEPLSRETSDTSTYSEGKDAKTTMLHY